MAEVTQTESVLNSAQEAALRLASDLQAWMVELPDRVGRPADLERVLGLDYPVAWRFYNVAHASSAADVVAHLPTINQLRGVVRKGASRLPKEPTRRALEAIDRFERTA